MNQAQILYQRCKRIAKDNPTCLQILLKVMELDRKDILDQIDEINKLQYNAITPEGIVRCYNEDCNQDIDKFIARYDRAMDDARYIRKEFYNDYESEMRKNTRY